MQQTPNINAFCTDVQVMCDQVPPRPALQEPSTSPSSSFAGQ